MNAGREDLRVRVAAAGLALAGAALALGAGYARAGRSPSPAPAVAPQAATATPLSPTPALTPTPTPSATEPLRAELERFVRAKETNPSNPVDLAIAVIDLQTGEVVSVDGDERHRTGCVGKVFPAFKYVDDVQRGLKPFDDWFEYYLARTVRVSNNADSYTFITAAGIRETNEYLRRIGLEGTLITHPPAYYGTHERYGYTEPENWTTAGDAALLFAMLWRNELFPPYLSAYVIDVMTQGPATPWEYGVILADSVPAGVRVAHKIGYTYGGETPEVQPDNVWNDAGLVIVDREGGAQGYAIAILQQNLDWYGGGPAIGREANRIVFSFFNQRYGWGY